MTNRVGFHGDASLPHYVHRGHFEYGPEVNGIPSWQSVKVPRELWGEGYASHTSQSVREYYRQWDHRHLLPYVPVRPEHRICRGRELGNLEHYERCACSSGRNEGEAPGTALLTHTANYTVLACWDYTGDMRGGCYSMFWIKGKLSANDMVAAIRRDFPCIWARITAGGGTMEVWGDDPPPMATAADVAVTANVVAAKAELAPAYDLSVPDEFFTKALPELVQIVEDATPVNERLRHASARR